jgi:hypothetical protein
MEVFLLRKLVTLRLYLSAPAYNARQALDLADLNSSPYHDLMNYVVGIVTLGTPFGGASAAKVARLRTHFARWLGSSSSSKLLEILEKRNPGINELKTSFCQVTQHRKIHVQYYYETQETNLLRNVFPKGIAEFWAWRGWFLEKASHLYC